jgi:hypothetical protein
MRRLSIISYFPQLGVALLSGAIVSTGMPVAVLAAPAAPAPAAPPAKPAPAPAAPIGKAPAPKAAPKGAAGASVTAGPDATAKKVAKDSYAAGEKAYSAGDYKTASVEFRKAYEAIPTIHAQFWLAMADSHGDDPAAAYEALGAVLASAEASKLGDDKLAAGNARLEELKKTPATLTLTSIPTGAEVAVDGAPQPGVTPLTASVPPGPHKVAFKLAGYDAAEADVTLKPGQKLEHPTVELKKAPEPVAAVPIAAAAAAPAAEPAPPPPKEERSKLPAYITLGVGAAAAGVGTVFGIMALGAKSDFNDNPTNDNADKADRNALIADMAFGVALTLGITGIVLLTTDDASDVSAKNTHGPRLQRAKLQLAPVITPSTQGAGARFTF